jgi:hypothetical protein
MGTLPRRDRFEMRMRQRAGHTHRVILTWETIDDELLLNVLNAESRLPETRQRLLKQPSTIYDLVQRSICGTPPSPRTMALRQNIVAGRGEIEIEITGKQYARMKRDTARLAPPQS